MITLKQAMNTNIPIYLGPYKVFVNRVFKHNSQNSNETMTEITFHDVDSLDLELLDKLCLEFTIKLFDDLSSATCYYKNLSLSPFNDEIGKTLYD